MTSSPYKWTAATASAACREELNRLQQVWVALATHGVRALPANYGGCALALLSPRGTILVVRPPVGRAQADRYCRLSALAPTAGHRVLDVLDTPTLAQTIDAILAS